MDSDRLDLDAIRDALLACPSGGRDCPVRSCGAIKPLLAEIERHQTRERRLSKWIEKLLTHHERLADHDCDWRAWFVVFDLDVEPVAEPAQDARDAEIARLTSQLDALQIEYDAATQLHRDVRLAVEGMMAILDRISAASEGTPKEPLRTIHRDAGRAMQNGNAILQALPEAT